MHLACRKTNQPQAAGVKGGSPLFSEDQGLPSPLAPPTVGRSGADHGHHHHQYATGVQVGGEEDAGGDGGFGFPAGAAAAGGGASGRGGQEVSFEEGAGGRNGEREAGGSQTLTLTPRA